jgi:glycosyltransferase involved in cell wall biosynthesis
MRILIITTGLGLGGAERALYNLVTSGLDKMGEIHVVSLREKSYYGELFESRGFNVTCLNLHKPINLLPGLIKLFFLTRRFKPNLIQGWMYHGNIFSFIASRSSLSKINLVWGVRQSIYSIKKEKFLTRITIRLSVLFSSFPDSIIYNSIKSKEQHENYGFDSKNGLFIPNGFDMKTWKSSKNTRKAIRSDLEINSNTFVIGYIGRFHKMKNIPMLFKVMNEVLKSNENILFLIAGIKTIKDNQSLFDLYKKLPPNKVKYLGIRRDIPNIMNCIDLLCLTSSWGEGFPNVIGEAMSSGVPCISSDVGDSAIVIGETGWVIPPDNAQALQSAINLAIGESKDLYQDRSSAATKRVLDNYQLKTVVQKYIEIYSNAE